MDDIDNIYKKISESRKSFYEHLLLKTKEYQREDPTIQPKLALMINEYILILLQDEEEDITKNIIWLENRLDNANKKIAFLTTVITELAKRHPQLESLQKELEETMREQEKDKKLRKSFIESKKERSEEIKNMMHEKESKIKKDFQ